MGDNKKKYSWAKLKEDPNKETVNSIVPFCSQFKKSPSLEVMGALINELKTLGFPQPQIYLNINLEFYKKIILDKNIVEDSSTNLEEQAARIWFEELETWNTEHPTLAIPRDKIMLFSEFRKHSAWKKASDVIDLLQKVEEKAPLINLLQELEKKDPTIKESSINHLLQQQEENILTMDSLQEQEQNTSNSKVRTFASCLKEDINIASKRLELSSEEIRKTIINEAKDFLAWHFRDQNFSDQINVIHYDENLTKTMCYVKQYAKELGYKPNSLVYRKYDKKTVVKEHKHREEEKKKLEIELQLQLKKQEEKRQQEESQKMLRQEQERNSSPTQVTDTTIPHEERLFAIAAGLVLGSDMSASYKGEVLGVMIKASKNTTSVSANEALIAQRTLVSAHQLSTMGAFAGSARMHAPAESVFSQVSATSPLIKAKAS